MFCELQFMSLAAFLRCLLLNIIKLSYLPAYFMFVAGMRCGADNPYRIHGFQGYSHQ